MGRVSVSAAPSPVRVASLNQCRSLNWRVAVGRSGGRPVSIDALIGRMEALLIPLEETGDARRFFHATYLRTTRAVRDALRDGLFSDPEWVERWDVAFADLYLDAMAADTAGGAVSRPWAVAFRAAREQPGRAGPAARPAGHERAHQLRPAAGAGRRDQRRGVRGSGCDRAAAGRPPAHRRGTQPPGRRRRPGTGPDRCSPFADRYPGRSREPGRQPTLPARVAGQGMAQRRGPERRPGPRSGRVRPAARRPGTAQRRAGSGTGTPGTSALAARGARLRCPAARSGRPRAAPLTGRAPIIPPEPAAVLRPGARG